MVITVKEIAVNRDDVYLGYLVLVNKAYPLKTEEIKEESLSRIQPEVYLENRAASMLMQLLAELKAKERITAVSGYRSFKEQESLYRDSLRENGQEFTKKYVALPGASEHQTGLAIDLGKTQKNIDFLCPEFPAEGICQEFRQRAALFGFIQRYEKEKGNITRIGHEPWHFRYVGYPHSMIIREDRLSLEEYEEKLESHVYGKYPLIYQKAGQRFEISYLKVTEGDAQKIKLEEDTICQISGNNKEGIIITKWQGR